MWLDIEPISIVPLFIQEPEDSSVQKPVPFSPPEVSYRSGRPRSWPNSCVNTPTPPFSGWMVYLPTQKSLLPIWMPPYLLKLGPATPIRLEKAYQEWLQMASAPNAPPPASSPSPEWIDWK